MEKIVHIFESVPSKWFATTSECYFCKSTQPGQQQSYFGMWSTRRKNTHQEDLCDQYSYFNFDLPTN